MPAGRPKKFTEPSGPITVTLPARTLRLLEKIDSDRGRAIVKCAEAAAPSEAGTRKQVEVIKISENTGMIIVGPSRSLASIPWLRLLEIAPTRYLISIPLGSDIASLEIAIMDLIEHQDDKDAAELALLEELRQCLSHHRRKEVVTKGEVLFIDL